MHLSSRFQVPLFAALTLLVACSRDVSLESNIASSRVEPQVSTQSPPAAAQAGARALPDFTTLVARYGDAVVNVRVIGHAPADDIEDQLLDFFHHHMPGPGGGQRGGSAGQGPLMHGTDSGFIVSSDGY